MPVEFNAATATADVLTLDVGCATHVGHVREHNEDSPLTTAGIFAVADGMGGHAAGEIASRLAVAQLEVLAERPELNADDLVGALNSANIDILASAAASGGERTGMGTTVAGLGVVRVGGTDHWAVFNVGDSRVYRFRDGNLAQITVDHSEVQELIASNQISEDEARVHPRRNVVTRSLGTEPPPIPDVWVFPPSPDERFLICSDGLPLELNDDEIGDVLRHETGAQRSADELVARTLAAGGRDNVTVIVVDLLGVSQLFNGVDGDTAPRRPQRET